MINENGSFFSLFFIIFQWLLKTDNITYCLNMKNESWQFCISITHDFVNICFQCSMFCNKSERKKNIALFWFCISFTMLVLIKDKKVIISLQKLFIVYFCISGNAYFIKICEWFHLRTNIIHTFLGKLSNIYGGKILLVKINVTLYFFNLNDSNFNLKICFSTFFFLSFFFFFFFLNVTVTFVLDSHCPLFYGEL